MHDKAVLHYVQTCKYIDVNPLKDPSAAHRPQLREPPQIARVPVIAAILKVIANKFDVALLNLCQALHVAMAFY